MTTQYWLVKQEPESYAWSQFVADRKATWEGVRNFQARNNLRGMKKGDPVLFYASGDLKEVVGIAKVAKPAFRDPTAHACEDWVAVKLKPVRALKVPITLVRIKADPAFADILLVRNSRLSVMPLDREAFEAIVQLGGG